MSHSQIAKVLQPRGGLQTLKVLHTEPSSADSNKLCGYWWAQPTKLASAKDNRFYKQYLVRKLVKNSANKDWLCKQQALQTAVGSANFNEFCKLYQGLQTPRTLQVVTSSVASDEFCMHCSGSANNRLYK